VLSAIIHYAFSDRGASEYLNYWSFLDAFGFIVSIFGSFLFGKESKRRKKLEVIDGPMLMVGGGFSMHITSLSNRLILREEKQLNRARDKRLPATMSVAAGRGRASERDGSPRSAMVRVLWILGAGIVSRSFFVPADDVFPQAFIKLTPAGRRRRTACVEAPRLMSFGSFGQSLFQGFSLFWLMMLSLGRLSNRHHRSAGGRSLA
jgi:hypothetical protein